MHITWDNSAGVARVASLSWRKLAAKSRLILKKFTKGWVWVGWQRMLQCQMKCWKNVYLWISSFGCITTHLTTWPRIQLLHGLVLFPLTMWVARQGPESSFTTDWFYFPWTRGLLSQDQGKIQTGQDLGACLHRAAYHQTRIPSLVNALRSDMLLRRYQVMALHALLHPVERRRKALQDNPCRDVTLELVQEESQHQT